MHKTLGMTMLAILGTGALLYAAGNGKLGAPLQKAAKIVTEGYGV